MFEGSLWCRYVLGIVVTVRKQDKPNLFPYKLTFKLENRLKKNESKHIISCSDINVVEKKIKQVKGRGAYLRSSNVPKVIFGLERSNNKEDKNGNK